MRKDRKKQTRIRTLWSLRVFIKKKTDGNFDKLNKDNNSNYLSIYNTNGD